ncbi:cytochrome-c peroxidase [Derxia lacustris]|uniref:cytochrome-c peroxidase n=1 Tax=Derxia lacustris TaxID=764842 RepID=UPI000A1750DB|nr:cytochrome c peroxidase [Derxia lacustris]
MKKILSLLWLLALLPATALPASFYGTPFERQPSPAELTELGRALFSDARLSASGRVSCASCHDPAHAYGPPDGRAVRLGGADLRQPGLRAVPSLRYQQDTPPFSEHFSESDGDDSVDQGPTGGRDWDGRAASAHEQAAGPLLSPFEMANASMPAAVARLRQSPNAGRMRAAFGAGLFDDDRKAWNALLLALEVFQQSPQDFYPYSSKYDAWLRRQTELSPAERRGLALFDDPAKGNCAQCHVSAIKRGAFPQFTDRGFIATGVPRNRAIPANADPGYFDLGLCGPLRTDLRGQTGYCGMFKTPTLRNVATRSVFFHNGVFHRLEDAVRFYAERDVHPERFYPRAADGKPRKFDDLPAAYAGNVNREPPFDRSVGQRPALTAAEIADVVAFLRTLTDGYRAPAR